MVIVFWRALLASLVLFVALIIFRKSELTFSKKHIGLFLALGVIGIAGFFIVYIYAITLIGVGIAAVLLYTSIIWVTLFNVIFQKEKLNWPKWLIICMAFIGIALISQIYKPQDMKFSLLGLFAGLGAGLGYAAYIILNKSATQFGYSPWTVSAYGLGVGTIVLLFIQNPNELQGSISNPNAMLWLFLLGIGPTLGGSLAFYAGLQRLPAVNASIVATFEPVVAASLGWFFFTERMDLPQIIGGFLIICSVILIQIPRGTTSKV
jgi:DME family drug/metabolite transporter